MTTHTSNVTTKTNNFFNQLIQIANLEHKTRVLEIKEHEAVLERFQADIDVLAENNIYVQALPEKNYVGGGYVRMTIPAYTTEFQTQVCQVLATRGFVDTSDSTYETRVLQRDTVIFIVTTTPPKGCCKSTCSHHCRCK